MPSMHSEQTELGETAAESFAAGHDMQQMRLLCLGAQQMAKHRMREFIEGIIN